MLAALFGTLGRRGTPAVRNRHARSQRRSGYLPVVDPLEDRVLLATSVWNGAVDGTWLNAGNWVGGIAPSAGDDLVFPPGAYALTGTNDFPAETSFNSITFSGGGYNFSGNLLVFMGGIRSIVPTGTPTQLNTLSAPIRLGAAQTFASTFALVTLNLTGAIDTDVFALTVDGAGTVNLSNAIGGGGELIKNGAGTLELRSNVSTFSGLTTINAGTVSVFASGALGSIENGTIVQSGAMLSTLTTLTLAEPLVLNGVGVGGGLPGRVFGALFVNAGTLTATGPISLGSDARIGVNGTSTFSTSPLTLNGQTLTLVGAAALTFNRVIEDGAEAGAGNLVIEHTGIVTLTAANTYTGTTTVRTGTLTLSGNGTLASGNYVLERNGMLRLDNSGTNLGDRIPDGAAISLFQGRFAFMGRNGEDAAETVGAITLAGGHSQISSQAGTGAATATVTAASLARNAGATFNASGTNLGTAANRILFATAPTTVGSNGGILPYGSFTDNDFATYGAAIGITRFAGYVTSLAAATETDTVKLTNASATVTANQTINGLFVSTNAAASGTVTINVGATLTVAGGGVFLASTAAAGVPRILSGTGTGTGTLDFGAAEGVIFRNASVANIFISATIAGSGGVIYSGLVGRMQLQPPATGNTYSGGTYFSTGEVVWDATGTAPFGNTSAALTFFNGNITSTLTVVTEPLSYPIVFHNATSTITRFSLMGPATLNGTANFVSGNFSLAGVVSGAAPLILTSGTLTLLPQTGPNTYTGGTVLQNGTLLIGDGNSPLGTSELTLMAGTFATSITNGYSVTNPAVASGSNTSLGTTVAPNNQPLTFGNSLRIVGNSTLTTNVPVTISGALTGIGVWTKTGTNSLVFSGAASLAGSVRLSGGTMRVNSTMTTPIAVDSSPTNTLGGTGTLGLVGIGNSNLGEVNPGNPSSMRGILNAAEANFGTGGVVHLQIAGYGTAGVDYDRLELGTGTLTLGHDAELRLDLAGLTTPGIVAGAIRYGNRSGVVPQFTRFSTLNNPNNFLVTLDYSAGELNLIIRPRIATPQIRDDGDAGFTATSGFFPVPGQGFQSDVRFAFPGTGTETATWNFTSLTPGLYRVSATWSVHPLRASNARFTILDDTFPVATALVNQQLMPNDFATNDGATGAFWHDLGVASYEIEGNTLSVRLSDLANGFVIADAIRIERVGELPLSTSRIIDDGDAGFTPTGGFSSASGQGFQDDLSFAGPGAGAETATWTFTGVPFGTYRVSATWTNDPNRATNAPFTIFDGSTSGIKIGAVRINQQTPPEYFSAGGGTWRNLGAPYLITTGTLTVQLTDDADGYVIADGMRIERLWLHPVTIRDDGGADFSATGGFIRTLGQGLQGDVSFAAAGTGSETAIWTFNGLTPGVYRVSVTYTADVDRATDARFSVLDDTTSLGTVQVNQQRAPADFSDQGAKWADLGIFTITSSTLVVQLTDEANGYVLADGVRIERVA